MSFATVYSRALMGVEAAEIVVETHLSNGLPGFAIVGLPETAVKESKERVRSAILNAGLDFPQRRITVNLAPADIPKSGGRYDLAIALSILAAAEQIPESALSGAEILGELALDGSVRPVQGALPAILAARRAGRRLLLPLAHADEMVLAAYSDARAVASLPQYLQHLQGEANLPAFNELPLQASTNGFQGSAEPDKIRQIRGQAMAKRAIQIAAVGGHNLLLMGPPGCGKTLLAQSMVELLPALDEAEALEVAAVRSVTCLAPDHDQWRQRPLRCPHHSASAVSLVGGGSRATPGEVTLAHRGVLFLDELTEFKPGVLDSLREPLEAGQITISRASYRIAFPADFQLIAAMNPCPCGHAGDARRECRCAPERVARYLGRLSGPLLDRIDMIVELPGLTQAELLEQPPDGTDWKEVRQAIAACQQLQRQRSGKLNAALDTDELNRYCSLDRAQRRHLAGAMDQLALSARTVHRILRVARSLADYAGSETIAEAHLLEALSFRRSPLLRRLAA